MTPQQWQKLLTPGASMKVARDVVQRAVRLHLATLPEGKTLSTEQLVEALYPRFLAEQTLAGDTARSFIYKLVAKLALNGLEDCCTKGPVNGKYMGKDKRPWVWSSPGMDLCCLCGQVIPKEPEEDGDEHV